MVQESMLGITLEDEGLQFLLQGWVCRHCLGELQPGLPGSEQEVLRASLSQSLRNMGCVEKAELPSTPCSGTS